VTSIGEPVPRLDGPAKVTGQARYAADTPVENLAHGALVLSTIPHGRIRDIDLRAAEAVRGVLAIMTHINMFRLRAVSCPPAGQTLLPLQSNEIVYEGQPVAVVVADTLEIATHAASLVRVDYAQAPAIVDFRAASEHPVKAGIFEEMVPSDTLAGDVEAALRTAAVTVEATYQTADRHHAAIEPSATIAIWQGDQLVIHDATQWVWGVRTALSQALGIDPAKIRVRSPFTGGGYGCKGWVWPHQLLAPVAARLVRRPVRIALTRAQTFTGHGCQPATLQTLALGADRAGKLSAIRHTSICATAIRDSFTEMAAIASRGLYACPAIETRHRGARLHRTVGTPMRAPWEGVSLVGLECAMDELAERLGMDPVELRIRNYAEREPVTGKPFSSKRLLACYQRGAQVFGWGNRPRAPRAQREGHELVGTGMATAYMQSFRNPASARVTLERGGRFLVEAGCQEIGTGVYTILPQLAAEALHVSVDRVRLVLGDTTLPETGGTFGSSTTMGVGSAVVDAATRLAHELARRTGGTPPTSPGALDAILERAGTDRLPMEGNWTPGEDAGPGGQPAGYAMATFGAVFAEVRVDAELCIARVSRLVGVYSCGRIVNRRTAHSQLSGGMVWGIGQALLEHAVTERQLGRFLSKNLSGYLVPSCADVPVPTVEVIDEVDPIASAFGGKGIGELAATGVGPAILNAVWHATGVRVRELPVTPERLLAGSPSLAGSR
jgi:xanthine dehydrogenase YagR molybdenum-binding subunit